MAKEKLTDKQELLLEYFFGDAEYDFTKAKLLAGYSEKSPNWNLLSSDALCDAIIKRASKELAMGSAEAVFHLIDIMRNPAQPAADKRLKAVTEILDRSGIAKQDKTEEAKALPNAIFILPDKVSVGGDNSIVIEHQGE